MYNLFLVATGGALGASFRFLISRHANQMIEHGFPWGTLAVNLLGCFLIGLLWSVSERFNWSEGANIFLMVGMLGSFTTFSTYGLEGLNFLQNAEIAIGFTYITASNVIGLLAVLVGKTIAESL